MKIRNGFVSNSSSSSFCIYGMSIDDVDMKQVMERCAKLFPKAAKYKKEMEEDQAELGEQDTVDISKSEFFYSIESELGKMGLEFHSINDEAFYIGRSWADIGNKQTGEKFKKEVAEQIKKVIGKATCCTYEEAWYPC